jgi:phosphomannomutase
LDVRDAYLKALTQVVDVEALRTLRGTIVHDAIGGAAAGWVEAFARYAGLAVDVEPVRGGFDPEFYGAHPEPIPVHLGPTIDRMRPRDAMLAVATDGDGDRLGAVLPGGRPLTAHEIFALLLDRRARDGATGRVVKTFTVARLVERVAAARGLACTETPVGFKWLVEEMLRGDVAIAGEESGGIGLPSHLPERDGIANAFALLEALAGAHREGGTSRRHDGPLGARLTALEEEVGWRHHYDRVDLTLTDAASAHAARAALASVGATFAGRAVTSVESLDGTKWNLAGNAWVMVRASGTEPLLRIYCEAASAEEVSELLQATTKMVRTAAGGAS